MNTLHHLGKYKPRHKRIKKYTLTHLDVDSKKKETTISTNLNEIRSLAGKMFRQNRFISLVNENGTPLTI